MPNPITYAAGPLLVVVAAAITALILAAIAVTGLARRVTWSRERRRRAGLRAALATVERVERITSDGHCRLTIAFATAGAVAYRDARGLRLRGLLRLPPDAIARLEAARALPVRFDPATPASVVVDLQALLGAASESLDRAAYLEHGRGRWKTL